MSAKEKHQSVRAARLTQQTEEALQTERLDMMSTFDGDDDEEEYSPATTATITTRSKRKRV